MEMTSLKMILHALPQDDMMELEQMIDSEKMKRNDQRYLSCRNISAKSVSRKMGGGRLTATQGMAQEGSRKR